MNENDWSINNFSSNKNELCEMSSFTSYVEKTLYGQIPLSGDHVTSHVAGSAPKTKVEVGCCAQILDIFSTYAVFAGGNKINCATCDQPDDRGHHP